MLGYTARNDAKLITMPKLTLLIIVLIVIILTSFATLVFRSDTQTVTPRGEIDSAVNQAKHVYRQTKLLGGDFSNGPCLSNALMPGWVADIVHSPRLPIDDLPENQCSAYLEGRAKHFVELDVDGNLIRAK